MATLNKLGNVTARCPGCNGSLSTYEYMPKGRILGCVTTYIPHPSEPYGEVPLEFRLFRCAGCGRGGMGKIRMMGLCEEYPDDIWVLEDFFPEAKERLRLPEETPPGIVNEFREAEICAEHGCYRASAAMFRSVLDKALRASGYHTKKLPNLKAQVDAAAEDGVITKARLARAHEDVRVFGNDVLHEEWRHVRSEDVEPAHQYTQRIVEDLYDDRAAVLVLLRTAGREADELKGEVSTASSSGGRG